MFSLCIVPHIVSIAILYVSILMIAAINMISFEPKVQFNHYYVVNKTQPLHVNIRVQ